LDLFWFSHHKFHENNKLTIKDWLCLEKREPSISGLIIVNGVIKQKIEIILEDLGQKLQILKP
jgi:hypothetical protein